MKLPKVALGSLWVWALVVAPALAQVEFPALTGRVVDDAALLSDQAQETLSDQLRRQEEKTGNQVVVVTVPGLRGRSIEDYGRALGNHWGIGQKGKDNGVLLVVAPNQRKVRIEVGSGLDTLLTDRIAQDIIDQDILPRFRGGDYRRGILQGTSQILAVLNGTYRKSSEQWRVLDERPGESKSWWQSLWAWIAAPFILLGRLFGFGRRRRGGIFGQSSGGSFSGGGGSFGGGGASGSW